MAVRGDSVLSRPYSPLLARTVTIRRSMLPVAYDCLTLAFARGGSALLRGFSDKGPFERLHFREGQGLLATPGVFCGGDPEEPFDVTVIYVDADFIIDQAAWKYSSWFADRLHAHISLMQRYTDPVQVLDLRPNSQLEGWLDELVSISTAGQVDTQFYRGLSLFFAVLDTVAPLIRIADVSQAAMRSVTRPALPRRRRFRPLRPEAAQVLDLLRADSGRRWRMDDLAAHAHLSKSQLSRIFVESFGKTPLAYLTLIRIEQMAIALRESPAPIKKIAQDTRWDDPAYAARVFRRCIGVTPSEYRQMPATRDES